MRKFLIPLALILALMILPLGAFASDQSGIKVKINDQALYFDVNPVIDSGRTLVPVRGIFETMGADVQWNAQTRTVLATKGGTQVKLQIDDINAYVNDVLTPLDVPAKIVDGRTMVPVRFISESFGATVGWDSKTSSVLIQDAGAKSIDYKKFYDAFMSARQAEFKLTLQENISMMGQVMNVTASGSGEVNNNDAHIKFLMSMPAMSVTMAMESTMKDGKIYIKMGDAPWTLLNTQIPQAALNSELNSEALLTSLLKESLIKQEDNVLINGKTTTKYTIKTDEAMLTSLVNKIFSAGGQVGMSQTPSLSDMDYLLVVYIDGQNHIAKQHFDAEMSGSVPELQTDFKIKAAGDIDYFNVGKPVTITAPAIN